MVFIYTFQLTIYLKCWYFYVYSIIIQHTIIVQLFLCTEKYAYLVNLGNTKRHRWAAKYLRKSFKDINSCLPIKIIKHNLFVNHAQPRATKLSAQHLHSSYHQIMEQQRMKNSNVIDNKHPVGCWWANGIFIEMHFYQNSNVGSWQIRLVHKIPREHCCILWSSWINMRIKSFVFKLYLVATKRLVLGLFVVLIVKKPLTLTMSLNQ